MRINTKSPCATMNTFVSPAQGLIRMIVTNTNLFPAHMRTTTELALVIKGLGGSGHQQAMCKI